MMTEKQSSPVYFREEPHYFREQVSLPQLRPMGPSEPHIPLEAGKRSARGPGNSACSSEWRPGISELGGKDF